MQDRIRKAWTLTAGLLVIANVNAAVLEGVVVDTEGRPVDEVLVTIEDERLRSTTISVLTNSTGRFVFPDIAVASLPTDAIRILKVGYELSGPVAIREEEGRLVAKITATKVENIADQISGSAWIARLLPDTSTTHLITLNCAQCHDFPSARSKDLMEMFGMLPLKEKEKVWHDIFKYMRVKSAGIHPSVDTSTLPPSAFDADKGAYLYATYNHADETAMVPLLAKHMPTKFEEYRLEDYRRLLAPVGTIGTVFREFELPGPKVALWHDTALAKGSDGQLYIYVIEWVNPRLARVNPRTGEVRTLAIPAGFGYGHTLVPDKDGNLWATLQKPGSIGRFDPRTETWKIWPAGGESGAVHSFANKARYEVGHDVTGGIWASLIGQNKLIRLNPRTGDTLIVDAPSTGDAPFQSMVYGGAVTSDGKKVWFTQLNGHLFSVDAETGKVEDKIAFPRGAGPRRLTIDNDDVLYVPLDGAGRIFVYDTKAKKELGRFALPDRAAGPYAATWDPTRNAVWTVGRNGKVYRFDVARKAFIEYPFPRHVLVHALSIDNETGDVFFSYGGTPQIQDPRMVAWLHPGEPEAQRLTNKQ